MGMERKYLSKPDVGHIPLYPCSDKCHAFIHAKLLEGFSEMFPQFSQNWLRKEADGPEAHCGEFRQNTLEQFRGAIVLGLPIFKHPWNSRSGLFSQANQTE